MREQQLTIKEMLKFHLFADWKYKSCTAESSAVKDYILGVERKTRSLKIALNETTLQLEDARS